MKIKKHYDKLMHLSQSRRKQILAMRKSGCTWQQIADAMGISRQRVQQIAK